MKTTDSLLLTPQVLLMSIHALKPHEMIIPSRMEQIKTEILVAHELFTPIWIEKEHGVVLNGHHRLAALKALDCRQIPCLVLDYQSEDIDVQICPGASISIIDKTSVIQAALSGKLFPPRSSLHRLKFDPPLFPVALNKLKGHEHRA